MQRDPEDTTRKKKTNYIGAQYRVALEWPVRATIRDLL